MSELVFLKLGGSVITDKTGEFTAREEVIRRLAREIRRGLEARPGLRLILGHGSGSFGHVVGEKYGVRQGVRGAEGWRGFAETALVAARLNRIVADILQEEGLPVMTFQPSASARCRNGELVHLDVYVFDFALERGLIPLLYGDVAVDTVIGGTIISTEQIFGYLAGKLRPARILLAGVVDGVYDRDPLRQPEGARHFPEITGENFLQVEAALGGSHGTDVTGGMLSKVRTMYDLALAQPPLLVHIFSGEKPGQVEAALRGETVGIGTIIHHLPQKT
jgi:isopentenyl phosphate kinase